MSPAPLARIALVVAVAVMAGGCGDSTDKPSSSTPTAPERPVQAQLTLERAVSALNGRPELVVSLPDARLNDLATTDGERSVLLACVDAAGGVVLREQQSWPLLEEPGFPPHLHVPVGPQQLDRLRACRLTGNGIDFEGSVPGPLPPAQ